MTSAIISPKQPDAAWLATFLEPSLLKAAPYSIDTPDVRVKLDQNESPWDWPDEIKAKVLSRLARMPWNRYPGAFTDDLADKVAAYAGVAPGSVLLGPGSNYLVSLALSVFSKGLGRGQNQGIMVCARPSFALYESHLNYEGIPYQAWPLNADLEYDVALLPELRPGSVVIFASPNNPVGNALPYTEFAKLLAAHPEVLFLADEAYFEYADRPYTDLLSQHSNVLLLRTFSKTLGAAGVRIGYILAHPALLAPLRKLRLPFLLNHFAIATAETILEDSATQAYLAKIKSNALAQRQLVDAELRRLGARDGFKVKASEANFLLLRWPDNDLALAAYHKLIRAGILVRNVMGGPGLAGCLRVTIGSEAENLALLNAMRA